MVSLKQNLMEQPENTPLDIDGSFSPEQKAWLAKEIEENGHPQDADQWLDLYNQMLLEVPDKPKN